MLELMTRPELVTATWATRSLVRMVRHVGLCFRRVHICESCLIAVIRWHRPLQYLGLVAYSLRRQWEHDIINQRKMVIS